MACRSIVKKRRFRSLNPRHQRERRISVFLSSRSVQFVGRINDFEIELESFVCLDKFGQLFEGQEDAVRHDTNPA